MKYVLDTNIFNKLIDGIISVEQLPNDGEFVASHIQVDEINNTTDKERRARLLLQFTQLRPQIMPTESAVWGVSRWNHAKWDVPAYEGLRHELDALNNGKPNNAHDALIAEVALTNGCTLLTADRHLVEVVKERGGKVVFFGT